MSIATASPKSGSGFTRLLNVDLLPRIKQINKVKLYRPAAGDPGAYPRLAAALTRPVRWDLIDANYDQVIKYATAIKDGTATTEAVLSRRDGRAVRVLSSASYMPLRGKSSHPGIPKVI